MTRILVLLAHFNGGEWIRDQVESILNQIDVEVHILIGDDNSSDQSSLNILRSFSDPRISCIEYTQSSGSAGQNFIRIFKDANFSNYDYVSFSDQDDIWESEKLSVGAIALKSSGASGYSSSVLATWPNGRERILCQSNRETKLDYVFEGAGQGCTFILTTSHAIQMQLRIKELESSSLPLHSIHYHDWLIYLLTRLSGKIWYFDKRTFTQYRQHHANDTGARLSFSGIFRRIRLVRSGWYSDQIQLMLDLALLIKPDNSLLSKTQALLASPRSIQRSFRLSTLMLLEGRRKISDRTMSSIFVFLRWL